MVRRPDFRLTVWLVTYASLTVSSMVLGDFSTLLRSARNDRGGRWQTVRHQTSDIREEVFYARQKHGWLSVSVSIAGLSESGVNAGLQEEDSLQQP